VTSDGLIALCGKRHKFVKPVGCDTVFEGHFDPSKSALFIQHVIYTVYNYLSVQVCKSFIP